MTKQNEKNAENKRFWDILLRFDSNYKNKHSTPTPTKKKRESPFQKNS